VGFDHPGDADLPRNGRQADTAVAAGTLTLRVAETFAPADAGTAQQKLRNGGVRGRLVIVF